MSESVWMVEGLGVLFATHEAETAAECAERGYTVTPYRRFVQRSAETPVEQPSGDTGELDAQAPHWVEHNGFTKCLTCGWVWGAVPGCACNVGVDAQAVEDEQWLERVIKRNAKDTVADRARRILARLRGSPVPAVEGGNDAGSDRT